MGEITEKTEVPTSVEKTSEVGEEPKPRSTLGKRALFPWWIKVIPFFLSALFFLSAFFALFSPLPLLIIRLRAGRKWGLAATLVNTGIVYWATGGMSTIIYLIFMASLAFSLAEFLELKQSIEKSALLSLLSIVFLAALACWVYGWVHSLNPWYELKSQLVGVVDYLVQTLTKDRQAWMDMGDLEQWKTGLLVEMPSLLAVMALVLVWVNLVLVLRINPSGIREKLGLTPHSLQNWKTPEWLVWPCLGAGFFLVVQVPTVSDISLNIFKFLMAIYVLQGLSVLSFFFTHWKVRSFVRVLGYGFSIFVTLPLLLSIGFFDLWFDFRSKFRQS